AELAREGGPGRAASQHSPEPARALALRRALDHVSCALVHLRLQLTLRDERPLAVSSLPLEPLRVVELLPSARLLPSGATHSEPPGPRRLPTATLGLRVEHARMELQYVLGGRAACVHGEHLRRRPTKT